MKSIKRNYIRIVENNPYWSTYTCFAEAVKGRGFGREAISRWFNKLVDKDDYSSEDKKAILRFLFDLSNNPPK